LDPTPERMVGYLFPGQGSQFVGMGREIAEASAEAMAVFEQADATLGFRLSSLCFEGPEDSLDDTFNTQPAILATSVAALRALQSRGLPDPDLVAGHSLGEFAALVAAGALALTDGLRLVRERGRLMKQAGQLRPGGMAAILGLERGSVEDLCQKASNLTSQHVGVANYNCPGQIVISGENKALNQAVELAHQHGARKVVRLAVSIGGHSPLMADAAGEFEICLEDTLFSKPAVPVVANATARPLTSAASIRNALRLQLTSPVYWEDSVCWMIQQGAGRFIEVGPGEVLTGLLKRIDRSVERRTTAQALFAQQ
jgi:[acyl-carrier-protein] S-malonyltransferase